MTIRVQFKFKLEVDGPAREETIRDLSEQGASRVRPLFPEEEDRELAALYVLDAGDEGTGKRLLELLSASSRVEFAEREPRRKLIR